MARAEPSFHITPTGTRWLWRGESDYKVDDGWIEFHRFGRRRAEREARRLIRREQRRRGPGAFIVTSSSGNIDE